jgi:hypothetical protein
VRKKVVRSFASPLRLNRLDEREVLPDEKKGTLALTTVGKSGRLCRDFSQMPFGRRETIFAASAEKKVEQGAERVFQPKSF